MSRVTIKSIASDLGISHMTVSRALSNSPNVQKETRERVQKRARELGYIKSAVAMAMRGDAPKIIGLLLPNIVNEFYARFANEMATKCDKYGQQLVIHLTNDDITLEQQALDRLQELQASSVVMVPAPEQANQSAPKLGALKAIELIRRRDPMNEDPAILVDDGPALRAAVRHLVNAGHQRIAYIGANCELSSGRARLDAILAGAKEAQIQIPSHLIRTGAPSFAMGRAQAKAILEDGQATALICGGFELSNGALSTLIERTGSSDRKIDFIGYGDPSFYAWVNKGISTIRVPVEELAKSAVAMASADAEDQPAGMSFAAELIIR